MMVPRANKRPATPPIRFYYGGGVWLCEGRIAFRCLDGEHAVIAEKCICVAPEHECYGVDWRECNILLFRRSTEFKTGEWVNDKLVFPRGFTA